MLWLKRVISTAFHLSLYFASCEFCLIKRSFNSPVHSVAIFFLLFLKLVFFFFFGNNWLQSTSCDSGSLQMRLSYFFLILNEITIYRKISQCPVRIEVRKPFWREIFNQKKENQKKIFEVKSQIHLRNIYSPHKSLWRHIVVGWDGNWL